MNIVARNLAAQRQITQRSRGKPHLPARLQKISIFDLPAATHKLLEDTHPCLREDLIEQLVWAVKSENDDERSRAGVALVSLAPFGIVEIGEMLLHHTRDTGYRLRLIYLLAKISVRYGEATVPLMKILSATNVPEILEAARLALTAINETTVAGKPGRTATGSGDSVPAVPPLPETLPW